MKIRIRAALHDKNASISFSTAAQLFVCVYLRKFIRMSKFESENCIVEFKLFSLTFKRHANSSVSERSFLVYALGPRPTGHGISCVRLQV